MDQRMQKHIERMKADRSLTVEVKTLEGKSLARRDCSPITAAALRIAGDDQGFRDESERIFCEIPEADRRAALVLFMRQQVRKNHDRECHDTDHAPCRLMETVPDYDLIAEFMLHAAGQAVEKAMQSKSNA